MPPSANPKLPNTKKELEVFYTSKLPNSVDLAAENSDKKDSLTTMVNKIKTLKETNDSEIQKLILEKRKEQLLNKFK